MKISIKWFITGNYSEFDESDEILNSNTTILELKGLIQLRYGYNVKYIILLRGHILENDMKLSEIGAQSNGGTLTLTPPIVAHVINNDKNTEKKNQILDGRRENETSEEDEENDEDIQFFTHQDFALAMRMLGKEVAVNPDRLREVRAAPPRLRPSFLNRKPIAGAVTSEPSKQSISDNVKASSKQSTPTHAYPTLSQPRTQINGSNRQTPNTTESITETKTKTVTPTNTTELPLRVDSLVSLSSRDSLAPKHPGRNIDHHNNVGNTETHSADTVSYTPRDVRSILDKAWHGMRMTGAEDTYGIKFPGTKDVYQYWDMRLPVNTYDVKPNHVCIDLFFFGPFEPLATGVDGRRFNEMVKLVFERTLGLRVDTPRLPREAGCMYPLVACNIIVTEQEGMELGCALFEDFGKKPCNSDDAIVSSSGTEELPASANSGGCAQQ